MVKTPVQVESFCLYNYFSACLLLLIFTFTTFLRKIVNGLNIGAKPGPAVLTHIWAQEKPEAGIEPSAGLGYKFFKPGYFKFE